MIRLIDQEPTSYGQFRRTQNGILAYHYIVIAGKRHLRSPEWILKKAYSPDLSQLIEDALDAYDAWRALADSDPGTVKLYLDAPRTDDGLKDLTRYPQSWNRKLKEVNDAYEAKFKTCFDLTNRLQDSDGFDSFCELEDPKHSGAPYYAYRLGSVWTCRYRLTKEQWEPLIDQEIARHADTVDRVLRSTQDGGFVKGDDGRAISAAVRREVWRRDGGQCVQCGSRERLEFDHIIPVSMGGSNTVRNIQLLCERCNRSKRATLG